MWNRFLSRALVPLTLVALVLPWMPAAKSQNADQFVALDTTKGRIVIRVFYSMVPYTAGRFLELVDNGFYNGLTWHRVENWVIQGGDPNGNGSGSALDENGNPRYLRLEVDRRLTHNEAGMVAMARSNNPNSASCQFYILKHAMPQLNGQYAVFGRVVDGARVVMSIQRGDRILGATILQQGGGGGGSADESGALDPVPGASSAPARAPMPPVPVEQQAAPPPRKPAVPGKYSLPGNPRRQTEQQPPEQPVVQQQAPPPPPRKPEESGF